MNRPYTFMLVAVSMDGKISPRRHPGQPNPIGPPLIDADIMKLHNSQRANADGIMVGLNCILLDDSRLTLLDDSPLTLRDSKDHRLTRIVLDGLAEISPTARVLNQDAPTIVAVTSQAPSEKVKAFQEAGAQVVVAGDSGRYVDLVLLMNALYGQFAIKRLLVEGGGTVHQSMISAGLYDELHLLICPFVIGGSESITPVERNTFWPMGNVPTFKLDKVNVLGDYLYVIYKPK